MCISPRRCPSGQDELDSVLLGEKLIVLGNLEPFKFMCSLWGATPLALGFPGS